MFLAYLCGISAFGLLPRVTLEIPGGESRLNRIVSLIRSCRYSVHDMSWVTLDATPPPTPRFNMPFELGLSVSLAVRSSEQHDFFLFEAVPWRLQKSLSDLNGTDPYIHGGAPEGVFRELAKAFAREERQPTVKQMTGLYEVLNANLQEILGNAAATDPFGARAFRDIVMLLSNTVELLSDPSSAAMRMTQKKHE